MDVIQELFHEPLIKAAGAIIVSIIAAWVVEMLIARTIAAAAAKTKTEVDDKIVEIIRRPIFFSVLIYGLEWAVDLMNLSDRLTGQLDSLLKTLVIFIWSIAATRVGAVVLQSLAGAERKRSMLQPRTLPVFDILMRILVLAAAIYFMFLAWHIDLTAWLASAGILGIAFGFAAKDTLANLFSGVFILADGPYQVHDWIVLDKQLRGQVTHIGIRSTRILTPDDVEITVPNAVIGNAQVLNETGGPYRRQRLRIKLSVAYGSAVDQVRQVLMACTEGAPHILDNPPPRTRFRLLGESGLDFELWVWIDDPQVRELVIDDITTRVYNALNANDIEIPFPKQDVYIKQMPSWPPPQPGSGRDDQDDRLTSDRAGDQ